MQLAVRAIGSVCLCLLGSALAVAQTQPFGAAPALPAQLLERLLTADRGRALLELRQLGRAGTAALADATLLAVQQLRPTAAALAQALSEAGHADAALPQLLLAIPFAGGDAFDALLHALGNAVMLTDDARLLERSNQLVTELGLAGRCYSEAGREPSFAWYEYVRLRRRLALARAGGPGVDRVNAALDELRAARTHGGALFLGAGGAVRAFDPHDLNAHGAHGQRETLEAIAELTLREPLGTVDVVRELANYLAPEQPRPGVTLTEHCAGIGEQAPVDLPGVAEPTRWRRDDWRFACARTVFARHPDAAVRQHALRHLLHAPSAAERIDACAAVRQQPAPWDQFADDLAACLRADDRAVVREALVTLSLGGASDRIGDDLERLAEGSDRELATLARKVRGRRR